MGITFVTELSAADVRTRLGHVSMSGADPWLLSVALVRCNISHDGFEMSRAARARLVSLTGRIEGAIGATRVTLTTRSTWSRAWPAITLLALCVGLLMVVLNLYIKVHPWFDLLSDLLVPLLSGMFTVFVIFLPTLGLLTLLFGAKQRRWLLGYANGLLASQSP